MVAHHRDLLGLTFLFGRQRRCSRHLLGFSVRLLLVPLRSPRDSVPKPILLKTTPSSTCTHSPEPIVRTWAPCTAVASLDFALAEASADKPPADHHLYNFDLVCPRFLQTRLVLFGTPLSARTPTNSLTWRSSRLTSFCCMSSVPPELSLELCASIELDKVVHRHGLHVVGIVVDGELYGFPPCLDRSPVYATCSAVPLHASELSLASLPRVPCRCLFDCGIHVRQNVPGHP